MEHWKEYSLKEKITSDFPLSIIIIKEIGKLNHKYYNCGYLGRRPQRSRLIKDRLSLLGRRVLPEKPRYCVYANGISHNLRQENGGHFKNAEWLYDMHWYSHGDEDYTTIEVPLVMECEWNPRQRGTNGKPFSGIKYDFQKLLLANANLRLMIFRVVKKDHLAELYRYFSKNIEGYKHLLKNSRFLFIAFPDDTHSFSFCEIIKKSKHHNS